ncbi:MAG: endonuclease/exonuclease/phosphatase family protein [Pseudomonadota bacterium]
MARPAITKFDFLSLLRWLACASAPYLLASVPTLAEPASYTTVKSCAAALSTASTVRPHTALGEFTIVSWNAMKFARSRANDYLQELALSADFVFLQESRQELMRTPAELGESVAGPKLRRYFAVGYVSDDLISGVELRGSLAADVLCELRYLEPLLRTPKAVLVARIPFKKQTLLLINVHAINFTITTGAYREQLDSLARLLEAHSGPAVVGGDLNTWNRWRTAALKAFAEKSGLEEVSFTPDYRSEHFGSKVDTFMVRDLRVKSSEAIPTEESDHHGIRARLTRAPTAGSRAVIDSQAPER